MRINFTLDYWRLGFAALFLAGFFFLFPSDDFFVLAVAAMVSFLVAGYAGKWFKKTFFKPVLLFDLHNVLIAGDWEVEDFYELPGTREFIRRLRRRYFVAALTNMSPSLWKMANRNFGFSAEFDAVYYSGRYGIRKPDARVFQIVLRDLGVRPADVIFIDDREENVAAARKLGMAGVVFQNASQGEKELSKLGIKTK